MREFMYECGALEYKRACTRACVCVRKHGIQMILLLPREFASESGAALSGVCVCARARARARVCVCAHARTREN